MSDNKQPVSETTSLLDPFYNENQTYIGNAETNGLVLDDESTPETKSTNEKGGEDSTFSFFKLSGSRKYILVLCTFALFWSGVAFSLLGPFYPIEAEKKGMSLTVTGLVFGIFQLIIFITSPFYGAYLTRIGPKFVYLAGIFVGGVCKIIFGTLDKCPPGTPFIVTSVVCRAVEALGFSGFVTASFAIVSSEFENNIGFIFGVLEMGNGLGYMIGPMIGGGLYSLGGYGLPFYFVGIMVLLNGALIYRFLPSPKQKPAKKKGSIFFLLRNAKIVVAMVAVVCGSAGISTFDATLAKHLEPFGLSSALVSLFFVTAAVLYSTMSLVWGHLTDKKNIQTPLISGGLFVYGIGFLLLGPSFLLPFVPFELWSLSIGLAVIGFSFGCLLIPTMKSMVNGAIELGLENNLDTYALVSGLFNSMVCLGGFVGPVGFAALIEKYGFSTGYTSLALLCIFMSLASGLFYLILYWRRKRREEWQQFSEEFQDEEQQRRDLSRHNSIFHNSLIISVASSRG